MSLKSMIRKYAKERNIAAQVVLQNYMFECFLHRLSKSKHKNRFIVKGGILISALVGLETRTTMDLDTTIRNLEMSEETLLETIRDICDLVNDDGVSFEIISLTQIRRVDLYGGYTIRIDAKYESIITPLSIDISTGDIVTPSPIIYELSGMFDKGKTISLYGYNIETILAEKVETILSRSIFSTRPRDFYDVYILTTTKKFDSATFQKALRATATHRGSSDVLIDPKSIIEVLSESETLKKEWEKYQNTFPYAQDVSFQDTISMLRSLMYT